MVVVVVVVMVVVVKSSNIHVLMPVDNKTAQEGCNARGSPDDALVVKRPYCKDCNARGGPDDALVVKRPYRKEGGEGEAKRIAQPFR